MKLGSVQIECPACGAELTIVIKAESLLEFAWRLFGFRIWPVIPDHDCPGPRGGAQARGAA